MLWRSGWQLQSGSVVDQRSDPAAAQLRPASPIALSHPRFPRGPPRTPRPRRWHRPSAPVPAAAYPPATTAACRAPTKPLRMLMRRDGTVVRPRWASLREHQAPTPGPQPEELDSRELAPHRLPGHGSLAGTGHLPVWRCEPVPPSREHWGKDEDERRRRHRVRRECRRPATQWVTL